MDNVTALNSENLKSETNAAGQSASQVNPPDKQFNLKQETPATSALTTPTATMATGGNGYITPQEQYMAQIVENATRTAQQLQQAGDSSNFMGQANDAATMMHPDANHFISGGNNLTVPNGLDQVINSALHRKLSRTNNGHKAVAKVEKEELSRRASYKRIVEDLQAVEQSSSSSAPPYNALTSLQRNNIHLTIPNITSPLIDANSSNNAVGVKRKAPSPTAQPVHNNNLPNNSTSSLLNQNLLAVSSAAPLDQQGLSHSPGLAQRGGAHLGGHGSFMQHHHNQLDMQRLGGIPTSGSAALDQLMNNESMLRDLTSSQNSLLLPSQQAQSSLYQDAGLQPNNPQFSLMNSMQDHHNRLLQSQQQQGSQQQQQSQHTLQPLNSRLAAAASQQQISPDSSNGLLQIGASASTAPSSVATAMNINTSQPRQPSLGSSSSAGSTNGNMPVQVAEEAARKREVRLLKNREAARECRRKKKEYIKCLENRVHVLEAQNKALIEELKTLKDMYCSRE